MSTSNGNPHFVGRYVDGLQDLLIAAMVSGVHTLLIGSPGTGKTSIARAAAEEAFGEKAVSFIRFNPTTPMTKVGGAVKIEKLVNPPYATEYSTQGTPYDPDVRAVIADELSRANSAVLDKMLDVLDRLDTERAVSPVVIATANFMVLNERTEAMYDRFAMCCWIEDEPVDTLALVESQLTSANGRLSMPHDMPDAKTVEEVRRMMPGPNAIKAISKKVDEFVSACETPITDDDGNIVHTFGPPNRRRQTAWARILFGVSAFHQGVADFNAVSPEAVSALGYAWMSKSIEEYKFWRQLCGVTTDPIQAAISNIIETVYRKMAKIANDGSGSRATKTVALGMELSTGLKDLEAVCGGDDEKFKEAHSRINEEYMKFIMQGTD